MTQEQYLSELSHALRGIDRNELQLIMGEYENHFRRSISEGQDEAAVANALGRPRRLARELKVEVSIKRWEQSRSLVSLSRLFCSVSKLSWGHADLYAPLSLLSLFLFIFWVAAFTMFFSGSLLVLTNLHIVSFPFTVTLDIAGRVIYSTGLKVLVGVGLLVAGVIWLWCDNFMVKYGGTVLINHARKSYRVVQGA